MKTINESVRRVCAIIIGVVFLLAGIFKLLDPVGAGLVVEDYFKFFHVGFLLPAAKFTAVALALLESVLGAALICGVWKKTVAVSTSALIAFFTIVTLILAVFNPPMDCGCFGEVVHLTNFQTFLKNLVLLATAAVAFLPYKDFSEAKKRKYVAFGIASVALVAFMAYSLVSIPLVDYTSFTPGCELLASTDNPSEAFDDIETRIIYEKNGREGAFPLDRLPDSTWTFVRTETVKRHGPEVEDNVPLLSFTDEAGDYQDELATVGNVLVISVYDPASMKEKAWKKVIETIQNTQAAGVTPLLIMASSPNGLARLENLGQSEKAMLRQFTYFADYKTIISLNRSNGGRTWFRDGELVKKHPSRVTLSTETIAKLANADPTETMLRSSTRDRLRFDTFLLFVFSVVLLL